MCPIGQNIYQFVPLGIANARQSQFTKRKECSSHCIIKNCGTPNAFCLYPFNVHFL